MLNISVYLTIGLHIISCSAQETNSCNRQGENQCDLNRPQDILQLRYEIQHGLISNTPTPIEMTASLPKDCSDVQRLGGTINGVYAINSPYFNHPLNVYCDLTTDGGGWTVFQRRQDGSVDFYRTWNEYREGFGNPNGELWLGNKYIHAMTESAAQELRIELGDWENNRVYAKYTSFRVESELDLFTLNLGEYSGTANGEMFSSQNGKPFTTKDRDNDDSGSNCAVTYPSGFWFISCFRSNLNGVYQPRSATDGYAVGIIARPWKDYYYSLKFTEMKMRPVQ